MKKFLLVGALAPALFAEISVFDAGNVDIAKPYGLTPSEKAMLKNKQHLEGLSKEYAGVDLKTTKALERIDGLQSIVDDLSNKNHDLETKLKDFEDAINTKDQARISENTKLKNLIYANSAQIEQLKKAIAALTDLIDNKAALIKSTSAPNVVSPTASNPQLRLSTAIDLFKSKNYTEASKEFQALIAIKHKPAISNYYLGECAYASGDYKQAIYYYKTSIDLYKAQKVKPANEELILLHTAKSLEHIGQAKQAQAFYAALKAKFPHFSQAQNN